MKKTKRTQLTALMFAAAGVGCMLTVSDGGLLYRVPADAAGSTTTTTTRMAQGAQLTVSASELLLGDVDDNGEVNAMDAYALQKYLHGKAEGIKTDAADLDRDGVVDVFDLGLLKREALAQKTPFPTTVPLYGPPEWFTETTESPTTMPVPLYGPPEWLTTVTEELTTTVPQDVYGPPNWFTRETTTVTTAETTTEPTTEPTTELTTDSTIEPTTELMTEVLYGPPNWFD